MVHHVKSMGASTAGVLSFKSILYSQDLVVARYFGIFFPLKDILTCNTGLLAFSKVTPFGVWGGPEKDRNVCFCGGGTLRLLSSDSSGQLDIFRHDGDSPGMNGTQVGVIK